MSGFERIVQRFFSCVKRLLKRARDTLFGYCPAADICVDLRDLRLEYLLASFFKHQGKEKEFLAADCADLR